MDTQDNHKICFVEFKNGKWIFVVPGEGILSVRDGLHTRALALLIMHAGEEMDPDDIDQAAKLGRFPIRLESTRMATAEFQNGQDAPAESDFLPYCDPEDQWKGEVDPDLRDYVHGLLPRHFGTVGDRRTVADIDRRVAILKNAKERMAQKAAEALEEERITLRRDRDWYLNPISGELRQAYSDTDMRRAQKIRMWLLRGARALAKGLPKTSAHLDVYVSRGARFVYNDHPGWKWTVIIPPEGSLPVIGKPDLEKETSKAA